MTRLSLALSLTALTCSAGLLVSFNGCGIDGPPIQHIVIIFQENRTPDNLFQDPVLVKHGADIAKSGRSSTGHTIPLSEVPLANDFDLDHSHAAFLKMCNLQPNEQCKMDGANLIPIVCSPDATGCPKPDSQFGYVTPSDVEPYFRLAEQYTFGDRMFQTNQGPSFPAHQFIISGTSAPAPGSNLFVAENPGGSSTAGCIAPTGTSVYLVEPSSKEISTQYPCFEHATLTDLLDARGISWRYYAPSAGSIWTGPDAIRHICQPQSKGGQLVCTGRTWGNVVIPQNQILRDIAARQLAQVTWVIPNGEESDHAQINDGSGPSWVAAIVNAIGNSAYWGHTAIFITWDDWGGWYDHVPPPQVLVNCAQWGCGYVYGFRVPLIVVSPFSKAGYISHVTHDFGSILNFIEKVYRLPSLGYADAHGDDLSDCFNFSQTPLLFQIIPAQVSAQHFLDDQRPPIDPDDD